MAEPRLTVLIDPAQKAELARRATALGVSLGEYVRRGALAYDPGAAERETEAERLLNEAADVFDDVRRRADALLAELGRPVRNV